MVRTAEIEQKAVDNFVEKMKQKLRENSHKAHWNTVSNGHLLDLLQDEVEELKAAFAMESDEAIQLECADVANFALFISDNLANGVVRR